MAIYRAGPLAGGISGAVGGVVFVEAKGSKVVRHRPPTVLKRRSIIALNSISPMAAFQLAIAGWRALTDASRQAWSTQAANITFPNRLGQQRPISAFNLYVMVNSLRALAFLAIMTTGPGTDRPIPLNSVVLDAEAGVAFRVTINSTPFPATRRLNLYGSVHWGGFESAYFRDFHYLGSIVFTRGVTLPITAEWEQVFGPLRTDQFIALRLIPWLPDTYPSSPWTQSTQVT